MNDKKTVSCLGPEGSYSHLAAETLCPESRVLLCGNFPAVFAALAEGAADEAVIPIENSIQGGVLQNLDLLERENVYAVEQTVLKIDHRLALKEGVKLADVRRVYSHEQAIGQCSEYLQKYLPQAECIFTDSTAKSLSLVDDTSAGIVGDNFTQFFRLVRREEGLPAHSGTVFFCAVCEHRPGSLLTLLKVFSDEGINLTCVESRPIRGVLGEYRFFIALAGDIADGRIRGALERARGVCRTFRILGAYL